jgi:hypothetical protein
LYPNDRNNDLTWVWRYYEAGRNYNNSLIPNQYSTVNTNWEFYTGNQWIGLPQTRAMRKLSKPVFNIIKRISQLFIASLCSSGTTISFEPLAYYDGENIADPERNAATYATAEVRNLFEKFKMEYKIRDALTDGAVTGDYCGHFFWNPRAIPYGGAYGPYRGEIEMELVDGIDVMFGNPNTRDVQSQPYVMVLGRDTVDHLKAEAEYYRKKYRSDRHTDPTMVVDANIIADADTLDMAAVGGKIEIEPDDKTGKALYAYFYTKVSHEETVKDESGADKLEPKLDENGDRIQQKDKSGRPLFDSGGEPVWEMQKMKQTVTTVYVTKATKTCVIYEDIDTGLSLYPVAWGNWEKQKNQYHGRALVTGVVPNQIFLNTMFATVMRHLQLLGFPKTVFNGDLIREWSNEPGEQIAVHGLLPNQSIQQVAYNLQPADMSNQIITTLDKTMQYTKECLGATDAQMGNVKPDNTSALMVLQSTSEVPLENIRANKNEWIEDIGRILLDMMGTYYHQRPIVVERSFTEPVLDPAGQPVIDQMTGMMKTQTVKHKALEDFDFDQFKHLWFNLAVEAGATTYYSEIAMVQTLDNLRKDGTLDVIDYLERLPDKLLPRRQELIDKMRQMMGLQDEAEQAAAAQTAPGASPAGASNPLAASNVAVPAKPQAGKGGPNSKALPTMGGALDTGRAMSMMPEGVQADFGSLPPTAQNSLKRLAGMKPQ